MTVGELKRRLSVFYDDMQVVVQECADYKSFKEANSICLGTFEQGLCGGNFDYMQSSTDTDKVNAILIQ